MGSLFDLLELISRRISQPKDFSELVNFGALCTLANDLTVGFIFYNWFRGRERYRLIPLTECNAILFLICSLESLLCFSLMNKGSSRN